MKSAGHAVLGACCLLYGVWMFLISAALVLVVTATLATGMGGLLLGSLPQDSNPARVLLITTGLTWLVGIVAVVIGTMNVHYAELLDLRRQKQIAAWKSLILRVNVVGVPVLAVSACGLLLLM